MIRHTLWAGWWALLVGMVMALLLTALRFGFPLLGEYRERLADRLSEEFGVALSIEQFNTRWNGPFPQFELIGIESVSSAQFGPEVRFSFDRLQLELNWLDSIRARAPIFQRVDAQGLYVRWYQREGSWLHLPGEGSSAGPVDLDALGVSLDLILAQPEFRLNDSELELVPQEGPPRTIKLHELLFENTTTEHQLSGDFSVPLLGEDTELSFAARLEGDTAHPSTLQLPFYLKFSDLGPELLKLADTELPLISLRAGAEVWGVLNQFGFDSLRGRLGVDQASVALQDQVIDLVDSSTEFSLRPYSEGYQIQFRDTHIGDRHGQLAFGDSQLELHRVAGDLQLSRIILKQLDLGLLDELLLRYPLPEGIKEAFAELQPRGEVNHLRVDFSDVERGPVLRANLNGVSLSAWKGSPAVGNLSGQLEVDRQGGGIKIDARQMELSFPAIYSKAHYYQLAQGTVRWEITSDAVLLSSDPIALIHQQFAANGQFSLDLPFDAEEQAFLRLMIGLQGADARAASLLTPDRLAGEALNSWLERSVIEGQVDEAGIVVVAPIRNHENRPAASVELYVVGSDVSLDYQPPWPAISGADSFTHMHQGLVRVDISQAKVLDSQMGRSVSLKPPGKGELWIWSQVAGELSLVDQLLRSQPLAESAGKSLDDWRLAGKHRSLLQLGLSLERAFEPKVRVTSDLESATFVSQKQQVALSDIAGQLVFDAQTGISAKSLTTTFLGQSAKAAISSSKQSTEVQFSGRWPVERLLEWGKIPLDPFVSGELPLSGRLTLCRSDQCRSNLALESNLAGTVISAPGELAKEPEESSRLSVDLALGSPLLVAVNYADVLRTSLQLGEPLKAHFRLGGGVARLPATAGVRVDAQLSQLELSELFDFIGKLNRSFSRSGEDGRGLPLEVDVRADQVSIGGLGLGDVRAKLSQLGSEMQVELFGSGVEGLVAWSKEQPAYRIALNRLYLQLPASDKPKTRTENIEPQRTSQSLFDAIPALDIDVADLRWNKASLGRWRGSLRHTGQSLVLSSIRGEMQDVELAGNASWTLSDTELTQLNLSYQGTDLGNTLASLGEAKLIQTDSLNGRLALAWEAAPWRVVGRYMFGNLRFDIGKGRLLEASGGSGLLRLFGILNLNSLSRRLQLDFTDLFAKGVVFDSLTGDFLIQDGIARSIKPMEMKGPSAGMLASGSIDLDQKTLDMQVNVSLPLVSNTPLAAVLLGAPQVAGALFLIDKLIGDKIEKATALAYTLRGSWDAPELKLLSSSSTKSN